MNGLPTKSKQIPLLKVDDKNSQTIKKKQTFSHTKKNLTEEKGENEISSVRFDISTIQDEALQLTTNEPFNFPELEKAVNKNKPTAPGHDKIPYEIYSNLPEKAKQLLLSLINTS